MAPAFFLEYFFGRGSREIMQKRQNIACVLHDQHINCALFFGVNSVQNWLAAAEVIS